MKANHKIHCAVAAILGAHTVAATAATPADATPAESEAAGPSISEIVVTATRREESIQNVPITVQALTGDTLQKLNVTTFDDFVKYTPNVTTANLGPGQSSIFMRGLSVGVTGQQGTGTTGPIPNVAVYLDDQSTALPGRNLDIYAADIERIEVLEGPQGTLFGSGAEAGVLRYITNKPKLDVTEGAANAGYSYTAHGDPNSNLDAMINLPLIENMLAVRAVVYTDNRGGYINNVPAVFQREGTDIGLSRRNGGVVPADSVTLTNANLTGSAINSVTYNGARLSVLFKPNDNWDALLQQSYQNMNAQGVFYDMPYGPEGLTFDQYGEPLGVRKLPELSTANFEPSYNKDRFESTSLTVDGKIGDLKLVYNGSYLVRNIEQQQDYTNYARGVYGYYYQCTGVSYSATTAGANAKCYSPGSTWQETERNTHLTQELRVSTPDDWRLRGIGGLYWEEFKIYDDTDWTYKTVPSCSPTYNDNCFNNTQPWPGATANNPNERNDNIGFFDDTTRTILQRAAYISGDFDIIPKTLILTAGTRYYHFDQSELGGDVGSFYCKNFAPTTYYGPCTSTTNGNGQPGGTGIAGSAPYGTNLNVADFNHAQYHGFRSRANLSWHVTNDFLLYYTWSQGFRPGGFNRGTKYTQPDATGAYQYATPTQYRPDTLINNEIGFKTEFLDHRLQLNGAIYQEDWKDTIVEFFAPQLGFGNLTFVTNGPNYRVRGGELQLTAVVTDGLTITSSGSYNKSSQVNSPFILNNNPASPNFGTPITQTVNGVTTPLRNVFNTVGSPLGESPLFQGNVRIRYEFPLMSYHAFAQVGGQYYGGSWSTVGTVNNYYMGGWALFDASVGASKDNWTVTAFVQNLANRDASVYTNAAQFILTQTPLRPRVAGLKFGYKF
ncbi:MAG TPA: TonB-dependent receptor [Steroidobacteraceae bacterium]|nr:TonB-dependent receptor [Steroidobacteraceae bacterium]